MKRPTAIQLEQLKVLRQYNQVIQYLDDAEQEYINLIIGEPDEVKVRQIQGSLFVLRELKKHIASER